MNNINMQTASDLCRSTYAEIDLTQLSTNYKRAQDISNSKVMAVVKADAYGHGAYTVAKHLYENSGARDFAVATYSEAVEVFEATGHDASILIYGEVEPNFIQHAVDKGFILTIVDVPYMAILNDVAKTSSKEVKCALKIDTGMSRIGIKYDENVVDILSKYDKLTVVHVYSHLSAPYFNKDFSKAQIERFENVLLALEDRGITTSLFASLGTQSENNKYDFTRVGISLYGYGVLEENKEFIKPILKVYSKIVHVLEVLKGESVGYSRSFIADKNMLVGVVAIGYADGYRRAITTDGYMIVKGVKCKVLGTVCMDMTMIDISALGEAVLGEQVEVLGEEITADTIASWCDTIPYEILCGLSKRVPRIYKR